MNIEEAKAISLVQILEKIGHLPTRQTPKEAWFLSPLRNEKTASFHVHLHKNIWYDFGQGIGGSVISFVSTYLERCGNSHTISDALRWLDNMCGQALVSAPARIVAVKDDIPKIRIKSIRTIQHMALIRYLEERGISLKVAKKHLKELWLHNNETDKDFFALGFYNDENGIEIRNPYFKGSLGTKDITFIRGTVAKPDGVHIFEGFMDFLSILEQNNGVPFKDDALILNSLSMVKMGTAFIKGYGYETVRTWLDNDDAGEKALNAFREFFKTESGLNHIPMNATYAGHKDVNAWHMHKLGL